MSRQSTYAKYTPMDIWPVFQTYLPAAVITQFLSTLSQRFYQRVFTPLVIVWGFLFQRLNHDHTTDAYVSYLRSFRLDQEFSLPALSDNNGAYCQARQRLPLCVAQRALSHTAQTLQTRLGSQAKWHGRSTYLLDGSTLRLKSEPALIEHYGRPSGRRGHSHWPVMRIVGAFDLWSGALQAIAEGRYLQSEIALAGPLFSDLPAEAVVVGDRVFGIYRVLQEAVAVQVDVLVRIKSSHVSRWSQAPLAAGEDRDVVWQASAYDKTNPDLPTPDIPGRLLYVRVEQDGFRPMDVHLFTTLTDRRQFPAQVIAQLYARRYQVELDLRQVKTLLEMEDLQGKSVEMVRKELLLGLTAYNLIRALMAEAAQRAGLPPLCLSFTRCWRRICDTARMLTNLPTDRQQEHGTSLIDDLLDRLSTCRLPKRKKQRHEPRAVWGKPQPYAYLKGSRQEARELLIKQWRES